MKDTFKTLRKKVNGLHPYIVTTKDNKKLYLFEVTRKTSYREIIKIEDAFLDDSTLIFASIDKSVFDRGPATDAANLYKVGNRKRRPLYYYNNERFYKSKVVEKNHVSGRSWSVLEITDEEIELITDYCDF